MLQLFLIKSQDGKYYRSKGYNGRGNNWVDTPDNAKIITKLRTAKGIVSWWVNNFPQYPAPNIIPLIVMEGKPIITDAKEIQRNKIKRELANQRKNLNYARRNQFALVETYTNRVKTLESQLEALK